MIKILKKRVPTNNSEKKRKSYNNITAIYVIFCTLITLYKNYDYYLFDNHIRIIIAVTLSMLEYKY